MNCLYIDAFSGVAGDMLLAALVDLGVEKGWLAEQLHRLPVGDFSIAFARVTDRGLSGTGLQITAPIQTKYRHLADIVQIITDARFSRFVTDNAIETFSRLAEAEARVHGCESNHVHFHEVGALDTIIDICGFYLALEKLGKPVVFCSPLPMPSGSINIAHGEYPLPAPAITFLLQGFNVTGSTAGQELVTPTGAAIMAVSAQSLASWPSLCIANTGYGAGSPGRGPLPNLVRVVLGTSSQTEEPIAVIEAQMDDITPEILAHTAGVLLANGVLDYYITPIYMKKSRPGFLLSVFCSPLKTQEVAELVLTHTSTLGVRHYLCHRQILSRCQQLVTTTFGPVMVKVASAPDGSSRVSPEYEDCARLARLHNKPLAEIYLAAQLAWEQQPR